MEQEKARVLNGERIREIRVAPAQGYVQISLDDRNGKPEAEWFITAAGFVALVDRLVRARDDLIGPPY
jgi:hypothetical protein